MKGITMLGSTLCLMATLGWADNPPIGQNTTAASKKPCQEIEQACTSAGFVKGGAKEGKGLYKNCMQPILKGQSVGGVTVDPAVVTACQQRKEKHREKKQPNPNQGTPNS